MKLSKKDILGLIESSEKTFYTDNSVRLNIETDGIYFDCLYSDVCNIELYESENGNDIEVTDIQLNMIEEKAMLLLAAHNKEAKDILDYNEVGF